MGDRVRIPALGQHGHRDDAPDRLAELTLFADSVHHFAEQILIGQILSLATIPGSLNDLAAEPVDLLGGELAEVVVERLARLELLAINQERVWARHRVPVLIEVPKQGEAAVLERGRS